MTPQDAQTLVVTDLDGTLLDYRTRSVPDGFGTVLDRILASGAAFAVASGRTPDSVRSLFPGHADRIWIASDNGAMLSHGGDVLFEHALEPGLWHALSSEACRIGSVDVVLVGAEACYMRESGAESAALFRRYYFPLVVAPDPAAAARSDRIRKVLVCNRARRADAALDALRERFGARTSAVSAEPGWIDFMAAGVDKGSAVRRLQDLLGADPAECVCFGDWENDATMLAACGRSYAMSGGHPAALAAARYVAPPCDENGEMSVLDRLFPPTGGDGS